MNMPLTPTFPLKLLMKITSVSFLLAVGLITGGCQSTHPEGGNPAPKTANLELKFKNDRDSDAARSSGPRDERNVKVKWKLKDAQGGGGFDHGANAYDVISWTMDNPTNANFAIVLPSGDNWSLTNGSSWAVKSPIASWPAVLPASDGKVYLQFRPGAGAQPSDAFHYKIVVLLPGFNAKSKTRIRGQEFPPDSDPDIIDTTI